jgi:hypothetical protein
MMWVKWEDQFGTALVHDDVHIEELDQFFKSEEMQPFSCLKYTGYYDDTLYNHRQVNEIEKELIVVGTLDLPETAKNELKALIEYIGRISRDARKRAILKFYGE